MSGNPRASERQLAASDPHTSAWVSANAGSGKTKVLVDRVIRLLLDGAEPSRIMCLTFTKAAAAEMSTRLFDRLSLWVTQAPQELTEALTALGMAPDAEVLRRARQLFTRALETPGGLRIQTIHAFCERVLQAFPVEAGIVPRFTVLDDRSTAELLFQSRGEVLAEALRHPDAALGQAVAQVVDRVQPDAFDELMSALLARRAELQPLLAVDGGLDWIVAQLRGHFGIAAAETGPQLRAGLGLDLPRYRAIADALAAGSKDDGKALARLAPVLERDAADLADLSDFYLTQKGEPRSRIGTSKVQQRLPWLADFAAAEQQRLCAALDRLADLERLAATRALLAVAGAVMQRFEQAKRQRGAYDFDDLIMRTAALLADRADAQWVLFKLDGGIDHLLVDEAQDTSPSQWKIIAALTQEFFVGAGRHGERLRTVFAVGDRKQSIYSFQGADPDVFAEVQADFAQRLAAAGQALEAVDFVVSFRSAPEILTAVDTVFAPGRPARQGLDGSDARDWLHESNRRGTTGLVELWPLVEPVDGPDETPWTAPVDQEPALSPRRRHAAALAETIRSWIGRRRNAATGLAVAAGDILVLVQKRNVFFDALIRELRRRGVPVAGADRLKLADSIAVQDMLALAAFCLMPEDDHALACVLKSPILARPLGEEQLMAVAIGRGERTLWQMLLASEDRDARAAAAELARLVALAPRLRPYDFFAGLLVNARLRFLARLGGEANDALDALLGEAMRFEEEHPATLAGFVNWFAADETEIKRNMEQAAGEVRIMTVHGAKGLEAPIVILADTALTPESKPPPPLLSVESDIGIRLPLWPVSGLRKSAGVQALKQSARQLAQEEYRRLLYVAMTRARDELYVTGYAGERGIDPGCWYALVADALKPAMQTSPDGCWRLGPASVFETAPAPRAAPPAQPPRWLAEPARLADGSDASRSVTSLAETRQGGSADGAAARRGIVMHRLLQLLPRTPVEDRAGLVQRVAARAGLGEDAIGAVLALLAIPGMDEILGPAGLSEVPLMVTLPGVAETVTGRVDRLLIAADRIVAVDYKTGTRVPAGPADVDPAHLRQMTAYRQALRRIHPGTAVIMGLVYTEVPKLLFLTDDLLDVAAGQLGVERP